MNESRMRLENRKVVRLLAQAIEGEVEAIFARKRAEDKIAVHRDVHRKDHVHILAYKIMVNSLLEKMPAITESERSQLWKESIEGAVEHLRSKGQRLEKKHIPQLRDPHIEVDLSGGLEKVEIRESPERPLSDFGRRASGGQRPEAFPEDVWHALHRVWTFAAHKRGYDKGRFLDLENELLRLHEQGDREEPPIAAS